MLFDLPLHPLLVHAPVVLLPLTALGVVVLAFQKRRAPQLALALLGLIAVGAVTAIASVLSGNYLASITFKPETHERWGLILAGSSVVYLLVAGFWLWKVSRETEQTPVARPLGFGSAVLGVVVTAFTVLAGHSGAELAWSGVNASPTATPTASATSSTTASSTASSTEAITMDVVAQHNTAEDCWVAIDGNAYDLTAWVSQHPGGSGAISTMCGTDGTSAFTGQHAGDSQATDALNQYLLGPIS